MNSTSTEIIYEMAGSRRILSELTWMLNHLWLVGIGAEYAPRDPWKGSSYFGKASFNVGLPITVGVIEDRDWLLPCDVPGALTHFSSHDNRMASAAFFADFKAGLSLPLVPQLYIRPFLGLSYMYFKYEAWNGYLQYPSTPHFPDGEPVQPYPVWTPDIPKVPFTDGKGITYLQHWVILSPGAEIVFSVSRFSFFASVSISPVVFCYSVDIHHVRIPPFKYTGIMLGGFLFEPEGKISFKINEHLSLGSSIAFRLIRGTRGLLYGDLYEPSETVSIAFGDASGAAYQSLRGQAFLRFSF
jgi:outer membrane protease